MKHCTSGPPPTPTLPPCRLAMCRRPLRAPPFSRPRRTPVPAHAASRQAPCPTGRGSARTGWPCADPRRQTPAAGPGDTPGPPSRRPLAAPPATTRRRHTIPPVASPPIIPCSAVTAKTSPPVGEVQIGGSQEKRTAGFTQNSQTQRQTRAHIAPAPNRCPAAKPRPSPPFPCSSRPRQFQHTAYFHQQTPRYHLTKSTYALALRTTACLVK